MSEQPVLTFLGGTRTVTGSRFLLDLPGARVLVDCGLYQGLRELRRLNWKPFPVDPATIDAVVITHAHLDHCGYLPALAANGYTGPVHVSPGTAALAPIVLRDAAHLQEEDAQFAREKGFSKHTPPLPLYTEADAEKVIAQLQAVAFGERVEVAPAVAVTLQPAGHVLGSSSALLEAGGVRLVVSGDIGRGQHPLLLPAPPPPAADAILVESTYGDREHDDASLSRLAEAIRRTAKRGGSVLVPAFAVDRTEVVLHHLRRLMRAGEVPELPVYVDSPMALDTLEVYRRAIAEDAPELRPGLDADGDPFDPGRLAECRTVEASKALNEPHHPCVIVSASGMATGGRVLHHLERMLPDPKHTVALVGFQAEGTRGRALAEGATELKVHGRYVRVRADVVDVPAFSVHADASELLDWLRSAAAAPDTCYAVHGEEQASERFAGRVRDQLGWSVVVPRYLERVRLA